MLIHKYNIYTSEDLIKHRRAWSITMFMYPPFNGTQDMGNVMGLNLINNFENDSSLKSLEQLCDWFSFAAWNNENQYLFSLSTIVCALMLLST